MKTFLLLITSLLPSLVFCQVNIFDASTIPAALLKDASSVKRDESLTFTIKNPGSGNYKVHLVVTVLNATAKSELLFQEYSNKFRSLASAELKVYDAKGNQLNKYKKREMMTYAASDEDVDDVKITSFNVSTGTYPVTIEVDYEVEFSGFFGYENYQMQVPGQSVEKSSFTVIVPSDLDIRHKEMNTDVKPVVKEDLKSNAKIYTWTCNNMLAKKTEEYAGRIQNYFPWVLIAPNKINYDGHEGAVSGWKEMGLWYNNLIRDDKPLPEDVKKEIQNLVVKATSDKEKAKIIYRYLQENFRYVSIQLGIGGLKPFPAGYVHSKKYGDCKALSNYVKACLDAVNIKSYNAWITSDPYPPAIDPDFAYDPFNHQVLCMINGKDTTWLECTSKTLNFGELSSSTENRYALLLREDGGVLVRTPDSRPSKNFFSTITDIQLDENYSGKIHADLYGGGEFSQLLNYVGRTSTDRQKDYFVHYLGFPNPDEHNASFNDMNEQGYHAKLDMVVEKVPEFTAGSKMFLNPRLYSIWPFKMPSAENRIQDFYFDFPFSKTDTTVYHLPEGYIVETLPKARELKFQFGRYYTTYLYNSERKTVTTTARLVLDQQKIPAAKYEAARRFFSEVIEEFTDKVVVKKE